MKASDISFISYAEELTLRNYQFPSQYSVVLSEIVSRLAAAILLSPAALVDIVFHSLFVFPTFLYAIGKSLYRLHLDFTLPWQHLQRIRNAVTPLFLGSFFGVLHPYAGIAVSEPTDKHVVLGMLSSNTNQPFETPCSPIQSISLIENIAKKHRYFHSDGTKIEIFSEEHIKVLKYARNLEESLERLQAQEFIHKITNITLFVMSEIKKNIKNSSMSALNKAILVRISGLLIPFLTAVDIAITLLVQIFFLASGIVRLISGRGPIYTEVTTNPLMHITFLIQNILKAVGNLLGTFVWLVSPETGFKVSFLPTNLFFKLQMNLLMLQIKCKMYFSKKNQRFVVPILFGNGDCSALAIPTQSMHKTYLIVEKKEKDINLYWVNRPTIDCKKNLNINEASVQIRSMLDERFPFMDIKKLMEYPVKSQEPKFLMSRKYADIESQGNTTNCVVSNIFGMLEALDKINGNDIAKLRYEVVRETLMNDYGFYKNNFSPFAKQEDGYSLKEIWRKMKLYSSETI